MTDREQQIEETKQVIATAIKNYLEENDCLELHIKGRKDGTSTKLIAEALCNAGYKKESETAKEIFERVKEIIENAKSKVYVLGNNEFRQGYEKSIKDFDTIIDELREEYDVEIEE